MGQFKIVFKGEIEDGYEEDAVKGELASLFKQPDAAIAKMFGGHAVTIKKELNEATAYKYQKAISNTGAISHVVGYETHTADIVPFEEHREEKRRKLKSRRTAERAHAICPDRRKTGGRRVDDSRKP